ncbi:MAG: FecR family protein [Pseudomonadota bacterium]
MRELQNLRSVDVKGKYDIPKDPAARERRKKTLQEALQRIETYWWFNHYNIMLHEQYCAEDFRIVQQTFKSAERASKQNISNPNANTEKALRDAKEQNKFAREDFEICANAKIRASNSQMMQENNVTDFASFKAGKAIYDQRYKGKDDEMLHKRYSEELAVLDSDVDKLGIIDGMIGRVEVKRGGKWISVKEGMTLYLADHIRTGPKGRARIEYNDYSRKYNRGPTIFNIGSDSEVHLAKFNIKLDEPPRREGLIELIRGTIRGYNTNWGERSVFSVRTGTSLCGIRGTDVIFSYDPDTNTTEYKLNHGIVDVKTPHKTIMLKDNQKLEVVDDIASMVEPMGQEEWVSAMTETSANQKIHYRKGIDKDKAALILEHFNEALLAFKYRRPKEIIAYSSGKYAKKIHPKVKTSEGLRSLKRLPVKWETPCVAKCVNNNECKIYVNMWFDEVKGSSVEYVHVVRKEGELWKLVELQSIPDEENRRIYARQMQECGIY